jgi:hypothetical protein
VQGCHQLRKSNFLIRARGPERPHALTPRLSVLHMEKVIGYIGLRSTRAEATEVIDLGHGK